MRFYKLVSVVTVIILLVVQNTVNTGCSKPPNTPVDTTTINNPPPPPPPSDTVSLIKKLEVLTALYPNYVANPYRTYWFTYDAKKRLTTVGIKNYMSVLVDTFTTRLFYSGNNMLPDRIIMPNIKNSQSSQPARYDTTWFFYSSDGKLQTDSSNEDIYYTTSGGFVRSPMLRLYSYPTTNMGTIDWYGAPAVSQPVQLQRRDTVKIGTDGKLQTIKALYLYYQIASPAIPGAYALCEGFTYSNIINPLSKLNISGTPYSLIYSNVKKELLGNDSYLLVYNSNGFADYLDFISPVIPTLFYIGGYNSNNQMIGSGANAFSIELTPWTLRPTYPAEIKVAMSTSLAGDKYIYRYTY